MYTHGTNRDNTFEQNIDAPSSHLLTRYIFRGDNYNTKFEIIRTTLK